MGRKNLWKAERPTDCCIYLHALHTHAAFKQHALTLCTQWILQFSIASKKYVKEQSSLFSRYRLEHLIDFSTFFFFFWRNVPIEANLVSQLSIQKALDSFHRTFRMTNSQFCIDWPSEITLLKMLISTFSRTVIKVLQCQILVETLSVMTDVYSQNSAHGIKNCWKVP